MPQKTIQSCKEFGQVIKQRRDELDLTIVEAATMAGVGIKTWNRYELGDSIRKDNAIGLYKALKWESLPKIGNIYILTVM